MKNGKVFGVILGIAITVFILVFLGLTLTSNLGKSKSEISEENAISQLNKILKDIRISEAEPIKAKIELNESNVADELPDIDKYPLSVQGRGQINVEIFSTSEKAGSGNDGWINEIAKKFNSENYTIDGKSVSVSIRPMASGMGVDYIVSGKYLPAAFTPSNNLFQKMIEAEGIDTEVITDRLVGNVAGFLLSKEKSNYMNQTYGSVNMKTITEATAKGDLIMGYTNPLASATGLNFLISTLDAYDSENPLSEKAISGFAEFQENVPFVAYTTLQMRDAADNGSLDGMVLEYQLYTNEAVLKRDYDFTPFGVRHDNPLFAVGSLTSDELEALHMFADYATSTESQKLASKYGFNNLDNYVSEGREFTGTEILQAQNLWKEEKDGGKPVIAVFVADVSGSMDGEPLNNLKKSLVNASEYIGSDNYVGLISYSNDVTINVPINKFDLNQRSLFNGAVQNLYANGGTASFDAVCVALDMINKAKEEHPEAKVMMFLLSDGETNRGVSLNKITGIVETLDVPIYTIGYNADISALGTISSINEAASINADSDDVVYKLKSLFNSNL